MVENNQRRTQPRSVRRCDDETEGLADPSEHQRGILYAHSGAHDPAWLCGFSQALPHFLRVREKKTLELLTCSFSFT